MTDSGIFDGSTDAEGRVKVPTHLQNRGLGGPRVTYRLRDWLISRQRYWGTPIPMVRCLKCGDVPVPEEDLPVLLPEGVKNWIPRGRSPLADVPEFVGTECPRCGGRAERDADTMDTFIDSSWYHLRYADPRNGKAIFGRKEVARWLPVDLYIGGREHATGHLLYFRFLTMVLHDEGLLDFEEPATRLYNHGMVQDEIGKKMSKSKGNLVAPAEMLGRYGVDASRVAMCFFAPSDEPIVWKEQGVAGALRFLRRARDFVAEAAPLVRATPEGRPPAGAPLPAPLVEARRLCHGALRNMSRAVETDLAFNTVVSDLMKALNALEEAGVPDGGKDPAAAAAFADAVRVFVRVLAPMAPHAGEEFHEVLGGGESVFRSGWPEFDPAAVRVAEVEYAVQANGKVRGRFTVAAGTGRDEVLERARSLPEVRPHLEGRKVLKTVFVENRLVNFVVG
jgi:leucyl-tRNA synthetase